MKKLLLIGLISLLFYRCNDSNSQSLTLSPDWELGSIAIGLSGEIIEQDLPFSETISFNDDGFFIKRRTIGDSILIGQGSYSMNEQDDRVTVVLNHDVFNSTIENCTRGTFEELQLYSNESLIGGSFICDGPTLFYVPSSK